MLRVTADTNVFISALMFGGLPGIFLDLATAGALRLVISPILLDELDEKLRGKFRVSSADALAIRSKLQSIAIVVEPDFVLKVIVEDADDDRVLECAIAGRANRIVSGDRHLLKIGSYEGISITTTRVFLESLGMAV